MVAVSFKQKTAYEITDCDWSSDVCSSDLMAEALDLADVIIFMDHGNIVQMAPPEEMLAHPDRKSVV